MRHLKVDETLVAQQVTSLVLNGLSLCSVRVGVGHQPRPQGSYTPGGVKTFFGLNSVPDVALPNVSPTN